MAVTRAYISRSNLRHNLKILQKAAGVPLCIALKANAYGHGAVETARVAVEEGVSCFGYARLQEAAEVVESGIRGRHILYSVIGEDEITSALKYGFELFVPSFEYLQVIEAKAKTAGRSAAVHIKIDTGMHRLGVDPGDAVDAALMAYESEWIHLVGVCTHFAKADDRQSSFTDHQIQCFEKVLRILSSAGITWQDAHGANSGGILYHPSGLFTLARPGISVYGYPPASFDTGVNLKPVMELVSTIVQVKRVQKGEPVSYGLTEAPDNDTFIGTVAVGYGDGYPRLLSSKGKIYIQGKLYPVIGRVCMDQCLVDLGVQTTVKRGDSAVVFGPGGSAWNADDVAGAAGTISYEITCGISPRVPRIYID